MDEEHADNVPLYLSRYYGFDVLGQAPDWDDVTRELLLSRVRDVPPIRFFTPEETRSLQAFADTLIPQDDRPPELRVPLVNYLDEMLHTNGGPGYRFEALPHAPAFWRTLAAALDEEARLRAPDARAFADLPVDARERIVGAMAARGIREARRAPSIAFLGAPPHREDANGRLLEPRAEGEALRAPLWESVPLKFAFQAALVQLAQDYYAHPYAWSEIGWAGPRFPRIYVRTQRDDPTEPKEVRFASGRAD